MSKKIIIVEPGTGNCYHSLAYTRDNKEMLDCLYSDDDKLCNENNCPLPDSDAWKKELLEWLNNKISACEINKTIDHDLGLPNSKELVCHALNMVIKPLKELKQKIQEM